MSIEKIDNGWIVSIQHGITLSIEKFCPTLDEAMAAIEEVRKEWEIEYDAECMKSKEEPKP